MPTDIDFYILEDTSKLQAMRYACQLIEKFHQEQKKIYVHTQSLAEAQRMDDLLWTFRDDSFIPHDLSHTNEPLPAPIQIGFENNPPGEREILINLNTEIPLFYQEFQRVIEIVFADPIVQQLGRDRFRLYREQGGNIKTYKIKVNEP